MLINAFACCCLERHISASIKAVYQIMGINQLFQATMLQTQVWRHANGNIFSLELIRVFSSEVISLGCTTRTWLFINYWSKYLWSLHFVLGLFYAVWVLNKEKAFLFYIKHSGSSKGARSYFHKYVSASTKMPRLQCEKGT